MTNKRPLGAKLRTRYSEHRSAQKDIQRASLSLHLLAQACLEKVSTNAFKHNINTLGIFVFQNLCKVFLLIVDHPVTSHRLTGRCVGTTVVISFLGLATPYLQ